MQPRPSNRKTSCRAGILGDTCCHIIDAGDSPGASRLPLDGQPGTGDDEPIPGTSRIADTLCFRLGGRPGSGWDLWLDAGIGEWEEIRHSLGLRISIPIRRG